jgi:predicted transcriptional regulator
MTSKQGTSVRLEPEIHSRLRDIAFLKNTSMGSVVAAALIAYVENDPELLGSIKVLENQRRLTGQVYDSLE